MVFLSEWIHFNSFESNGLSYFIELKLINYLQFIISPKLIGSGIDSVKLKPITNLNKAIRVNNKISKLGKEIIITLNLNS